MTERRKAARRPGSPPPVRTLRSLREMRLMRSAGLVVWEAHEAARALVEPGRSTAEIDAAIAGVFRRYDAEPLFLGYPGPTPFPAVACISVNEEVVHGIPGPRRLKEGDVVSIDTGCRLGGWCGDSAWTRPVGAISPRVAELLRVTEATLALAIDLLDKRAWWSELAAELERFVRDAGFYVVEDFVGHAIGREMHEDPQVPNYRDQEKIDAGEDFRLRPGVVLAIEPMVNFGTKRVRVLDDGWTQVTTDGRPSAHFEHTVALTANGPWRLTGPPEEQEPAPPA